MKISIVGLWHLGMTYCVGLAKLGHQVHGVDPNPSVTRTLSQGELIIFEPKLKDILEEKLKSRDMTFSSKYESCSESDVIFVTFDTPVREDDSSDTEYVFREIDKILMFVNQGALLVICSQLPIGSCKRISEAAKGLGKQVVVVSHPENLRLGKAFETFFNPDRLVFGTSDGKPIELLQAIFYKLQKPILWMKQESAEMSKHALNGFLATSITDAGEISQLCAAFGADAKEVELALKSDSRIGTKAYLSPGLGFSGGTLARDLDYLTRLQQSLYREAGIIPMILISNQLNNFWVEETLRELIPNKREKIVFCGITYVEGTDTLRRSISVETMARLYQDGYEILFIEDDVFNGAINFNFSRFSDKDESKIDALVIMKRLRLFELKGNYLDELIRKSTWILDPLSLLSDEAKKSINMNRYRSVGRS
jgi:UDPglucose 6-dehydrogenase